MPPDLPRVLVVDDEAAIRRVLRRLLERIGMTVIEAGSGPEALQIVGQGPGVDAIVCDVLMPEMSGLAFYDLLLARAPDLGRRVVFLTGAADDPRVHLPLEARGVPLVSKLGDLALAVDAVRLALLRPP